MAAWHDSEADRMERQLAGPLIMEPNRALFEVVKNEHRARAAKLREGVR